MKEREAELKNLFLRAQKNDEQAYQCLLQQVSQLLRAYLTQLMSPRLRSRERVEDLLQDILISIHRKRDLYCVDRPFLPWVYAIARYRFIDGIRSEKRSPEMVEWIESLDDRVFVDEPQKFKEESGFDLLHRLTPLQKTILTMAKVDDVPLREIAAHFQMSTSAVKVTIHRVLKSLRVPL